MAKDGDVRQRINDDIDAFGRKRESNKRISKILSEMVSTAFIGGLLLHAVQSGVNSDGNLEPFKATKAEIEAGTFTMPQEYILGYQEKCVRNEFEDDESIDLDDMSQDEVLALKGKFEQVSDCFTYDVAANEQDAYLESLKPTQVFGTVGTGMIGAAVFYVFGAGYFGYRRSRAEKAMNRRQNDLKLLD